MEDVRYISSSFVQAANPKEEVERIELSPWDLMLLAMDYAPKGLLYRKLNLHNQEDLVQRLKSSLSRTLDYFSILAGRLATTEHNNDSSSFFIDCNNAGVLFVHAAANGITVSDIIDPIFVPSFVGGLFQLCQVKNHEGTSKPLLAVQVTELADGIFISCTYNHVVVDGTSFVHFFNCWAEIARGCIELSNPLSLQRWVPASIEGGPIRIPNSCLTKTFQDEFIPPVPLKVRFFHFTKENIVGLKAKANAEVGTNKISSLQALLSHIWRVVVRNRNLDPMEDTNFILPVGAKSRLGHLSDQYAGNATHAAVIKMKVKDLLDKGVGEIAWEMNKLISSQSNEQIIGSLDLWKENPVLFSSSLASTIRNVLFLGGSPRFNYYSINFGWGRPITIRSGAGNKHDGKLTVYGGAEEGSMDIEATFSTETLQAMENDEEFIASFPISRL